jgi:hypothetical protein
MHVLEKFMQYAAAQGYTARRLSVDECFWPTRTSAAPSIVAGATSVAAA